MSRANLFLTNLTIVVILDMRHGCLGGTSLSLTILALNAATPWRQVDELRSFWVFWQFKWIKNYKSFRFDEKRYFSGKKATNINIHSDTCKHLVHDDDTQSNESLYTPSKRQRKRK